MTRLYLTNTASSVTSSSSGWAGATKLQLRLARGSGVASLTDNTVASIAANNFVPIGATVARSYLSGVALGAGERVWISEPLNGFTFANGVVSSRLAASVSSAMANYGRTWVAYHVPAGGGAAVRLLGATDATNEVGTSEGFAGPGASWSGGPTIATGDSIAIIMGYPAAGGTSASGFTATAFWNGTADNATGDSWIDFTVDTITEVGGGAAADLPVARRRFTQLLAH